MSRNADLQQENESLRLELSNLRRVLASEQSLLNARIQIVQSEKEELIERLQFRTQPRFASLPGPLLINSGLSPAERLRLLYGLQRDLLEAESFDDLCQKVVEMGRERLGFTRLGLWFLDETGKTLLGSFGTDANGKTRDERSWTIDDAEGKYSRYFEGRDAALVLHNEENSEQNTLQATNLMAAVRDGERLIGTLASDNLPHLQPFDETQKEILVLYALIVGQLCSRKRQEEALKGSLAEEREFAQGLRNLSAVSRELSLVQEESQLFKTGVARGLSQLSLDRLSFWVYDPSKNVLRGTYGTDEKGEVREETPSIWEVNAEFEQVMKQKSVATPKKNVLLLNDKSQSVDQGEQIMAPLWGGDRLLGVLCVDNLFSQKPFLPLTQELVSLYANAFSAALLRLREENKVHRLHLSLERRVKERTRQLDRELTLRHQIEKELGKSEKRLRLALESGSLGLWDFDLTSRECYYSPEYERMLGHQEGELRPPIDSGNEILHPEDAERANEAWNRHLRGESDIYEDEFRLRTKSSAWKWIYSRGRVVERNEEGRPLRAIGIQMDIDERKQLEESLRVSEERWKFALEGAGEGVWDWNLSNNHCFFSPRWKEMLGYDHTCPLFTFDNWLHQVHVNDRQNALQKLKAHLEGGNVLYEVEFRMKCQDGRYKWILSRGKVMERDALGKPQRMVGTHTDVSEHHTLQQALKTAEERWKFALEGSGTGIWDWNIPRQTVYFSPRWKEMLGYAPEELQATPALWEELVHPDDLPRVHQWGYEHLTGKTQEYLAEYRMKCKNGDYKWILSRGRVMESSEDGSPLRAVGTHTDISDRKKAELEIVRLNRDLSLRALQLEAANQELEAFSYSVSHDLRAPLRSIDGFSNALIEDFGNQLPPEAQKFMARISSASRRMGHLIDDLLSLSRIIRTEANRKPVSVTALVETVISEIAVRHPERNIEWVVSPDITADADENLLRIVYENLLNNAVKFTGKQAGARIEIGWVEGQQKTVYFVKDDGAGFDQSYADKLFVAFQRLHRPDEFEGTGIGLATVQRIVRKHGGRIWAEGFVEQGAAFYFTL